MGEDPILRVLEELGEQLDSAMDRVDEAWHALADWWWRG
jgi:hypothetical protein